MKFHAGRFLARTLRHDPGSIGISLDPQGWVEVETLLRAARRNGFPLSREILLQTVAENDKQRFTLSADGRRIRAAQGHSVFVDLGLPSEIPPGALFHGTARASLDAIFREGLRPMRRQHVHLSADPQTARAVGSRHGVEVVLQVDTAAMIEDALPFWRADNGVWLTAAVAPRYLSFV